MHITGNNEYPQNSSDGLCHHTGFQAFEEVQIHKCKLCGYLPLVLFLHLMHCILCISHTCLCTPGCREFPSCGLLLLITRAACILPCIEGCEVLIWKVHVFVIHGDADSCFNCQAPILDPLCYFSISSKGPFFCPATRDICFVSLIVPLLRPLSICVLSRG